VDVAGGGVREDVEGVAVTGVALERRDVVLRKRCGWEVDIRALEAARRQLRQIILGVMRFNWR
jgi:hypothetical protein